VRICGVDLLITARVLPEPAIFTGKHGGSRCININFKENFKFQEIAGKQGYLLEGLWKYGNYYWADVNGDGIFDNSMSSQVSKAKD